MIERDAWPAIYRESEANGLDSPNLFGLDAKDSRDLQSGFYDDLFIFI